MSMVGLKGHKLLHCTSKVCPAFPYTVVRQTEDKVRFQMEYISADPNLLTVCMDEECDA